MMDFDACSCSGRTLTRLIRPALMAAVAGGPVHGYRIARRLEQMPMFAEHPPDHAGIYRMLKAMEAEGLLTSTWDVDNGGPAKRRYELTGRGRACLGRWVQTLRQHQQAVGDLLEFASAALGHAERSGPAPAGSAAADKSVRG